MSNLWELEQAQEALGHGELQLCGRYLENALERVRCMYCHGALDRPHRPHYKGHVHEDCANEYDGRVDYMRKNGVEPF